MAPSFRTVLSAKIVTCYTQKCYIKTQKCEKSEVYRLFLRELLDALLSTMTLEDFKKLAQAVRPSGHQEEVAADDLLKQLALCAALLVSPGPQLLQEPSVDLGSLLLGHLYASRPPKSTCVYPVGEDG